VREEGGQVNLGGGALYESQGVTPTVPGRLVGREIAGIRAEDAQGELGECTALLFHRTRSGREVLRETAGRAMNSQNATLQPPSRPESGGEGWQFLSTHKKG